VEYKSGSILRDPIHILFTTGPSLKMEQVVHHPIGVTNLEKDEWVISSLEDVMLMANRREDPRKKAIDERRGHYIHNLMATGDRGCPTIFSDGKIYYRGDTRLSKPREDWLKQLRQDPCPLTADEQLFVNTEESQIRHWKLTHGIREEVETRFPYTFSTCGGPLEERPQVAQTEFKGLPKEAVVDLLIKKIYSRVAPTTVTVAPARVPAPTVTGGSGTNPSFVKSPKEVASDLVSQLVSLHTDLGRVEHVFNRADGSHYRIIVEKVTQAPGGKYQPVQGLNLKKYKDIL